MANNPLWAADDARLVALFEPKATGSAWSAADATANGMTLSNGGMTVAPQSAAGYRSIRGTISKTSGKLYVEFALSVGSNGDVLHGLADATFVSSGVLGGSTYSCGIDDIGYASAGFTKHYDITVYPSVPGEVWALAIDFTAGSVYIARNNVWLNSSNPATGTSPAMSFVPATVGALFPAVSLYPGGGTWTIQPTAATQKYASPSGFTTWDQTTMDPPITSAPSPPSAPGVTQPQYSGGSATVPPASTAFPAGAVGTWMPPPLVGQGGNVPFTTPVVPPGTGVSQPQPQYGSGSATLPTAASLFPSYSAAGPVAPIVLTGLMQIGLGAPPYTAGTQPILISSAPAIPQIPSPPFNQYEPYASAVTPPPRVGGTLNSTMGQWTGQSLTYSYQWYSTLGPIAGATSANYVMVAGDVGHWLFCRVTATNAGGAVTAQSNSVGTVAASAEETAHNNKSKKKR